MLEAKKIFIGGLRYEITEKDLESEFSKFGQVINARVVRDASTGASKGFGFVTFSEESAAQAALIMDGSQLNGRFIAVKIAFNSRKTK